MAIASHTDPKGLKSQRPISEWVRYFLPALRPFWKELCLAALAMVLDGTLSVFRPWPLKVVIDRVLSHKPSRVPFHALRVWLDNAPYSKMQILYGACAASLLIALLTGLLTYYFTRLLGKVGQRYVFALRRDLFAHIQRLSLRFHDRQRTGDLTHRVTSDIQSIQDFIVNGSIVFGSNGFLLIAMLVMMFLLDWRFALASLSIAPLLFWTVFRHTRRIKLASRRARQSTSLMAALAQEALSSIRIVQGLAQEDQLDERFQARSEGYLQAYLESIEHQARVAPLVDFLSALGLTIVIWYGATRVLSGELSTGDVVIFFAYVTSFYNPMKALARFSYMFNRASVAAERIVDVMSVQSELTDRKGSRPAPRLQGEIEFRDVSFEYEPGQPVLSHVNLAIAPGEKIAIVGATGAGKSTLVGLVPRFYDPTQGAVSIDGEDIRNYTLQSLREQISLVLQDSLLFSGTVRENITFGTPGASEEQVVAAAQVAMADEFIRRFPEGYDTEVAERGTTLSGGQKQRIAIARAVLRDAPILILDEPTTGLDADAEHIVIDALERAAAGRTTFIIAHRLSTVRLADRIIVIDHGRIIEEGTHTELLARGGRYAHLYHLQMGGEAESVVIRSP